MPSQRPSGTVTFLFTDVADSTRLWEESPADMAGAVRAHDVIVRGAIERHGGYVFATGGDGFCAAFSTAANAIAAAIESQRELSEAPLPFRVRMGLHTGEAVERDGNYFGTEVNRAARVMALGHGGQVLVSQATETLARDRVALRPLGEHPLRGLRGRVAVFQVLADGLASEFPVLSSADYFAGNLPHQVSSLVGRDVLVGDVADAIREHRLVTLTGVGGVGKTRLAIEVGADMASEFPDGIWIVELAGVGDGSDVPDAVATTLGVTRQGDLPMAETLAGALAGRRMLLGGDDCEHGGGAVATLMATLLGRSGHLRVLATSRESLGVTSEAIVTVPPLQVDRGVASEAVTLFADRARAVRPSFELSDAAAAAAVVDICAALDGLPLGIELAAARMVAMSPVEVRDRLADRFRLLQGSPLGPDRQSTLRHAVAWSYDLLTDDERSLLRVSSVFAGGFDLASVVAVADGLDEIDVLRNLDSLVRKSLVVADHSAVTTRYRLFETIRQFAEDRLVESEQLDRVRGRHAAHFAARASSEWDHWTTRWRDAVDWVELELDNLRSAFRWSSDAGEVAVATDIAAHVALMGFSVQLFETLAWAEELLAAATAADVARLPRLYTAAGYACFAGQPDAARHNARRATELEADPRYDPCEPGYAMFVEALGQVYCGDLARYVELTAEVATRYGTERGYALAAYVDGLQSAGRVDEALALTDASVSVARGSGSPYWLTYALWIAGMALAHRDRRRALAAWDEGIAIVREHRVHFFEGFLARDAARLHTSDGEADAALLLFGESIGAFHRAGNVPQLVITVASVPALFERLERFEPAATLLGAMSQPPSSSHHVPELVDMERRLVVGLGRSRSAELIATGATFDLDRAAGYAREQIALVRREPAVAMRPSRPGGLSRREVEVLRLVAAGRTSSEIASELFISTRTAEHHIANSYTKIGVSNRAAATRWAFANGVADASQHGNE
ncbi:MAG: adenylate/guanylate cyclase domain-containing protein [Actinobacteria bacterium]|nr:adenylate/guanylate cyclase domain-containing protein [Actinomycetota bacterium]